MNNILSEKEYQRYIIERLVSEHGYVERKNFCFDAKFAMDREMLFKFLDETQPETMASLRKVFRDKTEDTVVAAINTELTKNRGSLIDALKHGVEIANYKLNLFFRKPASGLNRELVALYEENIFSVMEEVWATDDERVDLVVFINGLALMSFELKCNLQGSPITTPYFNTAKRATRMRGFSVSRRGVLSTLQWISTRCI